jgi:hypothetical protein
MDNAGEGEGPPPEKHPVAHRGGRKKGWSYFKTRGEAEWSRGTPSQGQFPSLQCRSRILSGDLSFSS